MYRFESARRSERQVHRGLFMLFVLAAAAARAGDVFPRTEAQLFPERLQLTLTVDPDQLWTAQLITYKDLAHFVLESTPWGQDPYSGWDELLALAYWSGYQNPVSARHFLDALRAELLGRCPGAQFTIIEVAAADIVYEWRVTGCEGLDDQIELGRFLATEHGVHQASYTRLGAALDDEHRSGWLQVLRDARVKPIPEDFRLARNRAFQPHWRRGNPKWHRLERAVNPLAAPQSGSAGR